MNRRLVTAALLSVACAVGGVLAAAPAQAYPAVSGSLTLASEPGDPVGGGGTYALGTAAGDAFDVRGETEGGAGTVSRIQVIADDGVERWGVLLTAPDGRGLVPGTYPGAVRNPYGSGLPGITIERWNAWGCTSETVGSFTVTEAVYGTSNYVETFHATFEQHCDGMEPAITGEIRIDNGPQPAPLTLTPAIRKNATLSAGRAVVKGTVACTQPVSVLVSGLVTQVVRRQILVGGYRLEVPCVPGAAVPWKATVTSGSSLAYQAGDAEVTVEAVANDPITQVPVVVSRTKIVTLA
jgi:hypothetical protein